MVTEPKEQEQKTGGTNRELVNGNPAPVTNRELVNGNLAAVTNRETVNPTSMTVKCKCLKTSTRKILCWL